MENWKEYIDNKFTPTEDFVFDTVKDSNTISIKHPQTGTIFLFYWPTEDWKKLSDIQFYNEKTRGWSGEFNGELYFSEGNAKDVDSFLEPAFSSGWVSIDTYLGKTHWKSKVYFNKELSGTPFIYYSSEIGCSGILFFPLISFYSFLFGQKIKTTVEPIKATSPDKKASS